MMLQAQSLVGLLIIPLIAWTLSERRGALGAIATMRLILMAVAIQIAIAGLLLGVPQLEAAFEWPARGVDALQAAILDGMRLVFGYLAGGPSPFDAPRPERAFILAFQALPLILLVSVLSKLFYHWGVLQRLVYVFAWALKRTLGVSGPVGTAAAANIFVGMVEAPLLVRPYLSTMSRGGLFATMTVGMAGVAGTVLAIYASLLKESVPGAAGHLIIASVISVPAALLISQLMVPEVGVPEDAQGTPTDKLTELSLDEKPHSSMDAIAQGTREGVELLVNVSAMLIVAVALVSLTNMALGAIFAPFGLDIRLERCLGFAFAGMAWLIGIPLGECLAAGSLLGVKTVLNEFIAYVQLAALPAEALSPRSRLIMTYALCGFANLGSLGIMIGGISAMVPQRRGEIASLGARTIVSGTLATLMTAAVVGLLSAA
ncbi:MAG: nucleoside transporter C-terminal domain-containing protein [Hyphomicrobium sp.]|jgi:CNT family concentrative nucleoside transporter